MFQNYVKSLLFVYKGHHCIKIYDKLPIIFSMKYIYFIQIKKNYVFGRTYMDLHKTRKINRRELQFFDPMGNHPELS